MLYGIKLLPLLIDSFCMSESDLFKALNFAILSSMRDGGYFCFKRNVFSASSLTNSVLSSETIILIFLLNYMECCFVYVSDGMTCIKGTVFNR